MRVFFYDKTFEGLLSAVFDAYRLKTFPDALLERGAPVLSSWSHTVETSREKAARVFAGLEKRLFPEGRKRLLYAWLSEEEGNDMLMLRFMRAVFDAPATLGRVEMDFADKSVLALAQLARKVSSEAHLLLGFTRFQKTAQGLYFAALAPRHNVLSLLIGHFADRFQDQPWIVYDAGRGYGYFFENGTLRDIALEPGSLSGGRLKDDLLADGEAMFQNFWQEYCKAATIKERLNPALQRRLMPRRYWPHMTEMQGRTGPGVAGAGPKPRSLAGPARQSALPAAHHH